MSNVRKTLEITSLLFGMAVLFSYIAWHLGYEGFIIIGDIQMSWLPAYLVCSIIFTINMSLSAGYILDLYNWDVLWFAIPLTIANAIGSLFLPSIIFTSILPLIFFLILAIKKHGWKRKLIFYKQKVFRPLIISGVSLIHQLIVSVITTVDLSSNISMYQVFRLSISEVLLILLLFSIGGALYYESSNRLELVVFPGRIRDDRTRDESREVYQKNSESLPVNKFEVWVMRSVIAVVQVLQWMFILWVCNLDNLFLDALVITTSFICHGMIIVKRKHFKPIIICTLAATAMFYVAARFTISFQYSHFFPIFIGLLLVYTVYRISYQIEKSVEEKTQKEIERVKALEIKMEEAWKHIDKFS